MALQIIEKNGIFLLNGPINNKTSKSFKSHMDILINELEDITINIDKVNEIDEAGLMLLRQYHSKSLMDNKDFSIIGYGCKEIYQDFKLYQVA